MIRNRPNSNFARSSSLSVLVPAEDLIRDASLRFCLEFLYLLHEFGIRVKQLSYIDSQFTLPLGRIHLNLANMLLQLSHPKMQKCIIKKAVNDEKEYTHL